MGNAPRGGSPPCGAQTPKREMLSTARGDSFDAQELMSHLQESEGYEVYEFFEAEKGHRNARKLKGQSVPCVLAPRRMWAEASEEQVGSAATSESTQASNSEGPHSRQVEAPAEADLGNIDVDSDPWIVLTPSAPPPDRPSSGSQLVAQSKARPRGARGPPPPPRSKAKSAPGKPPGAKAKGGSPAAGKAAQPPPFGKKLHWKLLPPNSLEDTIFEELQPWAEVVPPLNKEQLKQIFCPPSQAAPLQKAPPLGSEGAFSSHATRARSGSQLCLIDNKRAQNLAIVLRQVSLPTDRLSEALRGMHISSDVTPDILEHVLENLVPSLLEVIDRLASYDGPVDSLRDVEKQLLPLAKLSRLKARLRIMLFSKNIVTLRDSLLVNIRTLRSACDQVRTSEALKLIFRTVLRVGNYLNHGIDAPDAGGGVEVKGFTVESLLKLRDFRAAQGGEFSALHVVALHLIQSCLPDFPAQLRRELREVLEPGDVGGAKITDGGISNVCEGVDRFKSEIGQVECEIERFPSSYSQSALAVLQQLLEDAKEMAQNLENELQEALVIAQKLLGYFGERCDVLPPTNETCIQEVEKFFDIIHKFVTSFEDCWREVLEQRRKLRLEGVTLPGRDRRDSSPSTEDQCGRASSPAEGSTAGKNCASVGLVGDAAAGEATHSEHLSSESIAFRRRKISRADIIGATRSVNSIFVQGD